MQESWATSAGQAAGTGTELHLDLDVRGSGVRRSLEGALRDAIQAGRLAPGTPLPSSRSLAADLGIARNTVTEAYGQLGAEGWLVAERGSGTRVADRMITPAADEQPPANSARGPRYSLVAGSPDLSQFPRTAWLAAARRALSTAPAADLGYGDPRGLPQLRQALAGYLARARGVRAAPDRIVVCTGFTQALGLLARVLAERGAQTLAVEAYGHRHQREVASAHGLAVRPVEVDRQGAVIAALAGTDGRAGAVGAVLLTPAHQFPLGVPLAARRRTQAVAWAAEAGATIIEDDYDGEFRYDRQAVGAMQALAPESVVYAGTASKTLAPGLRLAWLVLPAALAGPVAQAKELADRQTSSLDQLTLAELITSGGYDRQVRRARMTYRRRRERLAAELARCAPRVRLTGVAAGLHAVVELPAGTSEDDAIARRSPRAGHQRAVRVRQPRRVGSARARRRVRDAARQRVHGGRRAAVRGAGRGRLTGAAERPAHRTDPARAAGRARPGR